MNKYFRLIFIFGYLLNSHLMVGQVKIEPIPDSITTKQLNEVVFTGTNTFKQKTESAVIVGVINSKSLANLQVCNVAEGLKFQPGLRIETNCQTCNYTQLRMNGLQGGYSQILINGRPIFSPLLGLYGLEQLPAAMIDRIEVVRGGGSSLYGSGAIGGTVNLITKLPKKNNFELTNTTQIIGNQTFDIGWSGNGTIVSQDQKAGLLLFGTARNRDFFDANGDNFSELPLLKTAAMGLNTFYKFTNNQKLEISASRLYEYRLGGDMANIPIPKRGQAEERTHNTWVTNADYQINFNQNKSSVIAYTALQHTDRKHYTGILPDDDNQILQHLSSPPQGTSISQTWQAGFQINHEVSSFLGTRNVFTLGSEYLSDYINDQIPAYKYLVKQTTKNWGSFIQSDWDIHPKLNLLSGIRLDKHNFLPQPILNPRVALLYKSNDNSQWRLSYGSGFRAPQAFDSDLHIAFAGGGVSRVQLSPKLAAERSHSVSSSFNFDKPMQNHIYGFTIETFLTRLQDAFVLQNIGNDAFGEIFEKTNGSMAQVQGVTVELRANFNKKLQIESGFTYQKSEYKQAVNYIDGVAAIKQFLRTPNAYGFSNLNIQTNKSWNFNLNYVYTGSMILAHFGGAENFATNKMVKTKGFNEVNCKASYTFGINKKQGLEVLGGIKNIFNAYQTDFDKGKNRDSNYIYGPMQPRSIFMGLKFKSL